MEQLKVFCRGSCQGKATVEHKSGRSEIEVSMKDPADGLYRAVLTGEHGQLPLGVMEPHHGVLILRRRPYLRDVERLGALKEVQASRSFAFRRPEIWKKTDRPAELVSSAYLKEQLIPYRTAWWKKSEGSLLIALPWDENSPLPMESLFCFARLDSVDGRRSVVYSFDKGETPI